MLNSNSVYQLKTDESLNNNLRDYAASDFCAATAPKTRAIFATGAFIT
jgi:hypothetical protein